MPVQANDCIERYARFETLRSTGELRGHEWLTVAELRVLDSLRDENRREAWLCGRWLGKQLIRQACVLPATKLKSIEICSRDADGRGMRPTVHINGEPVSVGLSISHSTYAVLAVVTTRPEVSVGVDLAIPDSVKPGFLRMWFTAAEQERLRAADAQRVTTYWAIKEAVYKACHGGEGFTPRKIEVFDSVEGRFWCYYRGIDLVSLSDIRIREIDGHIAVVVTVSESAGVNWTPTNDAHHAEFCGNGLAEQQGQVGDRSAVVANT
jgi:phosphopantetheinyl transferase (holo-ACP synthase)